MAQDDIRKAFKGDRRAMQTLYDLYKSKVMCLCQGLLLDENEADKATASIFKKTFAELMSGRLDTEEAFSKFLIHKTIFYCKGQTLKKSSRAFRLFADTDFTAVVYDSSQMDLSGEINKVILKNLPILHRYIYVTKVVTGYTEREIAPFFNTTETVIGRALHAEPLLIARIAAAAEKQMKMRLPINIDTFHRKLVEDSVFTSIPAAVDATVKLSIQELCEPIYKAERRKQARLTAIILGVMASIAAVIVFVAFDKQDSNVDLDNPKENLTLTIDDEEAGQEVLEPVEDSAGADTDDPVIDATYYASITVENYGIITVALDGNAAPETVENFVALSQSGFYDGLTFHRIMEGFMMQGGDPEGTGYGGNTDADGNAITINGEFAANGFDNPLSHTAGAISMARSDDYNSASSQFFIVHTDDYTGSLDGLYACFGYVIEGMDVVDCICTDAEPTDGMGTISVDSQPIITSIAIIEIDSEDMDSKT